MRHHQRRSRPPALSTPNHQDLQQLSRGKASGPDAIPVEIYKHGDPRLVEQLTALFQEIWSQGEVPRDFNDVTIVHCHWRKGNCPLCDSHRRILLPNIAGEIFVCVLLNHLNSQLEQGRLSGSQCYFGRHRGTTDTIFAARQQQEKCQEMRIHLNSTFVDLTKAFDTVIRGGLQKLMQKFGCTEQFTRMVRQLHDGIMAPVMDNGTVSEALAVTKRVKQTCVLAPTLFSLMSYVRVINAYCN
nr:unnamed protein product [Spirometra erinaceieuropaei]